VIFGTDSTGGAGGSGTGSGGAGADGGSAIVTSTVDAGGLVSGGGSANGGAGGNSGLDANGGAGGVAAASVTATGDASQSDATNMRISVTAFAGGGGWGDGAGHSGGGGGEGAASAGAYNDGDGATFADAVRVGGAGGTGYDSANGGAGGYSDMVNAVAGSTNGGDLYLEQQAIGGAGGFSFGGAAGTGGAAMSILSFDDRDSTYVSAILTVGVVAVGGEGGAGLSGSSSAAGGSAYALADGTSNHESNAIASAQGGAGGPAAAGGSLGVGGSAQAFAVSLGGSAAYGNAVAIGGDGSVSGSADAKSLAVGASGVDQAQASTAAQSGELVTTVSGWTEAQVDGTTLVASHADLAGAGFSFVTGDQAVAFVSGAPTSAITSAVLSANPTINTAFGASPSFFAVGELEGAHSAGGSASQTVNSEISMTVDLTQLAARHDLMIGLFNGTEVGAGFTSLTFDLTADGNDLVHQVFSSVAAAVTYFSDNAIDLGSLASGALSANTLSLTATLTVVSDAANSGFAGELILGDPPSHAAGRLSAAAWEHHAMVAPGALDHPGLL
jgi:hypothetical protein